jgi:hypothetical protein
MPVITGRAMMDAVMHEVAEKALDNVAKEVLELLRKSIQENVYDPYTAKVRVYDRQPFAKSFLGSWKNEPVKTLGNTISATIDQDTERMEHDPKHFIHGSNHSDQGDDIREALAEILNEGLTGSYFDWTQPPPYWWKERRPYWDQFVVMFEDGTIHRLMIKEFALLGIKLI